MFFNKLRHRMKGIIILICIAFALTLLYVGGTSFFGNETSGVAVAKVNGEEIYAQELQQAYTSTVNIYRQLGQNVTPIQEDDLRFAALQQLVDYQIMLQAAKREDVDADRNEVNRQIQQLKDNYGAQYQEVLRANGLSESQLRQAITEQLMVEALRDEKSAVEVTEEDVRREYEEGREERQVRHILIEPTTGDSGEQDWEAALAEAQALLERVRAGEDFAELAKAHSDDTGSSASGGDLGWVSRKTSFVPEFLDAVFKTDVGTVSEPVRSQYGYHMINVTDQRVKDGEPFGEVKESLRQQLEAERSQQKFQEWMNQERAEADVEILDTRMLANQFLRNDRLDQAIAKYKVAIDESPNDPYLYYRLASALDQVGAKDEALDNYVKAAENGEYDPQLWFALGQAYRERGQNEKAKDALLEASELSPNQLQLHQVLASLFTEMGYPALAEQENAKVEEIQQRLMEQAQQRQEEMERQQQLQQQMEEAKKGSDQAEEAPEGSQSGSAD